MFCTRSVVLYFFDRHKTPLTRRFVGYFFAVYNVKSKGETC